MYILILRRFRTTIVAVEEL